MSVFGVGMRESFVSEYNPILDKTEYMYVDNKIIAIAFSIECLQKLVGRSLMHYSDVPATLVAKRRKTYV